MTTRLTLFFMLVSLLMGLICSLLLILSLHLADATMLEKRIIVEYREAVRYFQENKNENSIRLNSLTTAYSDLESIPKEFYSIIEKEYPFQEGSWLKSKKGTYIYLNYFDYSGVKKTIILISHIEPIRITAKGFVIAGVAMLVIVLFFTFLFKHLVYRLSKSLIEPINILENQLNMSQLDINKVFCVPQDSVVEFQILVDKFNEYTQRINELIKREQAFARYTSHELRTPLTIIKGASTLLEKRLSDPFEMRQINRVQNAVNQISNIIDVLLSLVRYERSEKKEFSFIITAKELENMADKHRYLIANKEIDFIFNIQGSIQTKAPDIVVDIVLGNILRNAISSTQKGKIYITLTDFLLEIRDEGVGLDSNSSYSNGYGLGLLIIEDLCNRYDWTFNLKNYVDKGCVATINFLKV